MLRTLGALITGAIMLQSADAFADPPPPLPRIPEQRINYDATVGGRLNPLGFEVGTNLAYRHRLFDGGSSLILRDNDFGVGLSPTISPSIVRLGGFVEFRPLTVLTLQAHVHEVGYLGSFDNLQRFKRASDDFSDTAREAGGDAGKAHPEGGLEVQARALALAKAGPIVIRDDLMFTYENLGLSDDAPLFYHPRFDVLAEDKSWFIHNDTDVAYLTDFGLIAAARLSLDHAFYSDENVGGDAGEDAATMLRLGPLVGYTFFDHPGEAFNKPTLIAIAQWWLMHRFRTGEDSSQAYPYIALAFRVEGDLFRSKD